MKKFYEIRSYLILWLTQMLSGLGSGMTGYALVIWSYGQEGSALKTALLMVCSYAPYVLCSIFAGALSDRWNKKKTMLVCDALAALSTVAVWALIKTDSLRIWHLYVVNVFAGLMNTVQQPASEVATTALLPEEYYQRVGALSYLSSSVNGILKPILATAFLGLFGLDAVLAFDLATFAAAFFVLLLFIRIPGTPRHDAPASLIDEAKQGLNWLRRHAGILHLMLFLAAINLVASMYDAAFPAMMLSRQGGSEKVMGTVNAVIGLSTLLGSLVATALKPPRSRVRVIMATLFISMCTENLLLALGRGGWVWCVGGFLGWFFIPLMNANLNAIMRLHIPIELQGRVYAARNSLQFFTIPVGFLLGGALVDYAFEPLMAAQSAQSPLTALFGTGKGSGAACFFLVLWVLGIAVCLMFRRDRAIWSLEESR